MHQIFQREKYLMDKNHRKQRRLTYFKSYNSTLDFQRSLACGMLRRAWQKMKGGGGKKETIFPLLKVLMRMKRILHSDFDLLKFRETQEGAGVSRKRNNSV